MVFSGYLGKRSTDLRHIILQVLAVSHTAGVVSAVVQLLKLLIAAVACPMRALWSTAPLIHLSILALCISFASLHPRHLLCCLVNVGTVSDVVIIIHSSLSLLLFVLFCM